jgi:hypothetical protein
MIAFIANRPVNIFTGFSTIHSFSSDFLKVIETLFQDFLDFQVSSKISDEILSGTIGMISNPETREIRVDIRCCQTIVV